MRFVGALPLFLSSFILPQPFILFFLKVVQVMVAHLSGALGGHPW
jgi:hypothetical protein